MESDSLARPVAAMLLLGLRIAPLFAFAPPFTLLRVPVMVRVLLGLGLAASLAGTHPNATVPALDVATVLPAAARELALGIVFVLVPQVVFGALSFAGRMLDVQAGFGLAMLIDPATRGQSPLIGTLFVYAAGAVFFATGGAAGVLGLLAASLDAVPLGAWTMPDALPRLGLFVTTAFSLALGFAAIAAGALFLVDLAIALMSRTVPQMNMLALGLQVKTLALLLVLPLAFGAGATMLVRLLARGFETLPTLL